MLLHRIQAVPTPYPDMHLSKNVTTCCSNADHRDSDWSTFWTHISSFFFYFTTPHISCMHEHGPGRRKTDQRRMRTCAFVQLLVAPLRWLPDGFKFLERDFHKHWCGWGNCRATRTQGCTSINAFNCVGHVRSLRRRLHVQLMQQLKSGFTL